MSRILFNRPRAAILKTDGTNCDLETRIAFEKAGANAEIVHINSLIKGHNPADNRDYSLKNYQILAIPGGFSYGDYIMSAKIFAEEIKDKLMDQLLQFRDDGKLIIGICNGFQVLVRLGILPNISGKNEQEVSLTYNANKSFECRWVKLVKYNESCFWTKGIESIDLPVAHGEGRFVAPEKILAQIDSSYKKETYVVFKYANELDLPACNEYPENPNGSMRDIAGICDKTGRIFGLMPHPERYLLPEQHYLAATQRILRSCIGIEDPCIEKMIRTTKTLPKEGEGLKIFRNAVKYFK